jgi:hypothetical protein
MPVEFNEESNQNRVLYGRFAQSSQAPKLVTWLLKIGIVKSESQANYVLIGIAVVAFAWSIYLFSRSSIDTRPAVGSFESMRESQQINN